MKRFIALAFLILTGFCAMGQNGIKEGDTPACDAMFSATPEAQNPMTIHFEDHSTGQITLWQWSFGDGATSTLRNPVHTYASGGTYFVCLTVSNTNTGVICHDVLCVAVTVHEPGKCIADYNNHPDDMNPLLIHFDDKSSGNVNRWHWTFGDGTSSDDRNPDHLFPSIGKFPVCLTAYHSDSISLCNDTKCDTVETHAPDVCQASFTFELDSANQLPRVYRFSSTSTGNPNHYSWRFGDGATAGGPYALHQFPGQGNFNVCLTVSRKSGGTVECADSVCFMLTTAKYFDLGGHLFIGNSPINNPLSTGDTGVAYLYRKAGSELIPVDTNIFTQMGYYAFPQVLNGTYVVKAFLTEESSHKKEFIPTYFPGAMKWFEGDSLELFTSNDYQSHIHLHPVGALLNGSGKISGTIVRKEPGGMNNEIPFTEVLLCDSQVNPVAFKISDQYGRFVFENLAFGSYNLYVEYPGKYSRYTTVWLDETIPLATNVMLEVFDNDVTGIDDAKPAGFEVGQVFPNPADNVASFHVITLKKTTIKIEILDLQSRTLNQTEIVLEKGKALATVPVGFLQPGVYLLRIRSVGNEGLFVRKLIKW